MEKKLLLTENLHTYFHTHSGVVKAVNGVDFTIGKGETLALVGESGCGKTVTALSIMGLIQRPPGMIVEGRILFEGLDLTKVSETKFRKIRGKYISMIFQEPMTSLDPLFTIGAQIIDSIMLHQDVSKRKAMEHAIKMLEKVAISDPDKRINELPHKLSGGMRQRVMIAIALSCNPKLLIADEPTTALDVTVQAQILNLMNKLKEEFHTSILIITHNLGVVAETAQSVAVMYAGRIVEHASVNELFKNPRHPYTAGLLASIPNPDMPFGEKKALPTIQGMVPDLIGLGEGCSFAERCRYSVSRCVMKNPPPTSVSFNHIVRCWRYAE